MLLSAALARIEVLRPSMTPRRRSCHRRGWCRRSAGAAARRRALSRCRNRSRTRARRSAWPTAAGARGRGGGAVDRRYAGWRARRSSRGLGSPTRCWAACCAVDERAATAAPRARWGSRCLSISSLAEIERLARALGLLGRRQVLVVVGALLGFAEDFVRLGQTLEDGLHLGLEATEPFAEVRVWMKDLR